MSDNQDNYEDIDEEYPSATKAALAIVEPPAPEPEPAFDVLDLDAVLTHTQGVRLKVQKHVHKALAQEVSADMLNVLLKTAGDMDKAVVSRRRVGIDEAAAKTSEQSQRDSAGLLRAMTSRMFQLDPKDIDPNRTPPSLDDSDGPPTLVPGQMDIGTQQLSYDAFAKGQQQAVE
jgi:type VI protein secretion system component VasA